MKKTLLVLSLIILAVFGAEAQKARVGLKAGANFANFDTDDAADGKTGFHFGAYAELGAGGFSIMPELLFSTKGDEFVDLSYIEVPVLLKKSFAKVLNLHVGPQFGFLTKAEDEDGDDLKEFLKGTDVSAVFGAGLDLPGGLTAGARYVLGLTAIEDVGSVSIKNKTFQIYIGYKLFGK